MNSHDDPLYRLKLAKRSLAKAENDAVDGQWDDCLAEAQEAVENAGKAILGHFRPIPKTHDVIGPLKRLTDKGNLPDAIRQDIEASLDAFRNMGLATHIRAAYGDELTGTVPWELIQEPEATAGLEKARRAVALAESVYAAVSGEPPTVEPETPQSAEDDE
ncbi:MAG: HEPN domain-containing protein [Chloroflexi bacterium]|nr:HEPN domain-containing protein [Chloroflexota bacterium]